MTIVKPPAHVHTAHDLKSPSKPAKMMCRAALTGNVPLSDSVLQSPTSRRRYMRRGSKSPSMLLLPQLHFDEENYHEKESFGHQPLEITTNPSRRKSLVSLLAQQLQETEIHTSSMRPARINKELNRQSSSNISERV